MSQNIYYAYEEFRVDLKNLTKRINKPFDTILGISRGGLTMAHMLGEYYDIRKVYAINSIGYEGMVKLDSLKVYNVPDLSDVKHLLIVDDISDSGDTLVEVEQVLREKYPHVTIYTATLFYKPTSKYKPTWWVKEPKGWIDFFWSEDLR